MQNKNPDTLQQYCRKIGVEPKRPIYMLEAYEFDELEEQIRARELELDLTPEEIQKLKSGDEYQAVNVFELIILSFVLCTILVLTLLSQLQRWH